MTTMMAKTKRAKKKTKGAGLTNAAKAAAPGASLQRVRRADDLHLELAGFFGQGRFTLCEERDVGGAKMPVYVNEYWTARQRGGHSLHEISYRACFKPQLPEFFIRLLSDPGDLVYDPFMGRGTTVLEACLLGRRAGGNDANPLSRELLAPRLDPPGLDEVARRLESVQLDERGAEDAQYEDQRVFFAERTLGEILGWRRYFREREAAGELDTVDRWLRMVACNRLTGHSGGFFSVYTLPPNQATSAKAQRRINEKRKQVPEYRDTRKLMLKKSRSLMRDPLPPEFQRVADGGGLCAGSADSLHGVADGSVMLVVTSPPFLNVVDYRGDNWLRGWFCEVEADESLIWQGSSLKQWKARMQDVFVELRRVLREDGWIAFEVGEVLGGMLELEGTVAEVARAAGLHVECVLVHAQEFTKTANCWGVDNNSKGTNTQRVVLIRHGA